MPSVEQIQPQQPDNRNDEIDLIDLMMQLWRAKLTIILFMVATLVLAGVYLVVAKEKWSSDAIVTMPDSGQTANYMNAMNVLYAQTPANAPSVVDVQERFFNRFNALVSAYAEQLSNQEVKEELTIAPTVKDLKDSPLKITYIGHSAQDAKATLTKYLQKLNQQVVRELDADLATSIKSRVQDLNESLASQEKVAREKQQQRLDIISQALKVAQASGIQKATVNQAETQSEDTLYLLGSEALSAMLKNESTRPLPLEDYYFSTRQALVSVERIKTDPASLSAFHYVMEPNLPVRRDSPKRGLVIVLAVLLGAVLGAGFVLGRNALRDYQRREAA